MIELPHAESLGRLLVSGCLGLAVGGFSFGGLWWTVQRLASSEHPALLVFVSSTVRMGVVVLGLVVAARAGWQSALACLVGILVARALVRCIVDVRHEPEARDASQS